MSDAPTSPFLQGIELQSAEPVAQPPDWFAQALETPCKQAWTEVAGCPVHYLEWGDPQKQDLLLVHGNGAHAHWFLPTGALLADKYHCISMTFSGMGDSGWRDRYDRDSMMGDILGLVDNLGLQKPILSAHSFGGMVAVPAAAAMGDRLGGLIIVDFVARPAHKVTEWFVDRPPSRPTRVYADKRTVLQRFYLQPEQDCANQWLLEFIADRSVRPVAGGWTWKFDPSIYDQMRLGTEHEQMVRSLVAPCSFLYGAHTREFEDNDVDDMVAMLPPGSAVVAMPQAQHHLMLDQPLAFAEVLGRLADELLSRRNS